MKIDSPYIYQLPPEVIEKISAGEVIERPASVVKELIENSLDAGADVISIFLSGEYILDITVEDNGHGMTLENLQASVGMHTTSKLRDVADLYTLTTLGFRGEALASIARSGDLSIASRHEDDESGYILTMTSYGKDILPIGMGVGTRVSVTDIFGKIPVRKKFLSTPSVEYRLCLEYILSYALINPGVCFTLVRDGATLFKAPKEDAHERLRRVIGKDLARHTLPCDYSSRDYTMRGYIGVPQIAQKSKSRQYLSINGRAVVHEGILSALKEEFGSLIDKNTHPVCVLVLDAPSSMLDINIHPRKEEVRFSHEEEVIAFVREGVRTFLSTHNLLYTDPVYSIPDHMLVLNDSGMSPETARVLRQSIAPFNVRKSVQPSEEILQVHDVYLIYETPEGVMLIDQHAAHERILYEEFKKAYSDARREPDTYVLPQSIILELPVRDALVLREHLPTLSRLGFEIESFGGTSYKITRVPGIYRDRNIKALILEVITDSIEGRGVPDVDLQTERTLAFLACRTAIKAGDTLSIEERRRLVDKLHTTSGNYTCPHGRPVMVLLTVSELEKLFKRV